MPQLDTPLHLDMLNKGRRKRNLNQQNGIYGLEWGDPETIPPLKYVRDHFLTPYISSTVKVAEIGVGGGRWTRYMLSAEHVYAVDYHQELLDELKSNYNHSNITFIRNNGDDFPNVPDASINLLFSFGTFVHLDLNLIDSYLRNIRRILHPDANVIIQYSDMTKPMAKNNLGFSDNTPETMRNLILSHGYEVYEEDDKTMWHSAIVRFGLKKQASASTSDIYDVNFLLLTYDSCRYDSLNKARTPVLDSFCEIVPAQTPANFTYPAHQAFFSGILPNATVDMPYYNRFNKQLFGLVEMGETNVVKHSRYGILNPINIVHGLADAGFQTVGTGAMNWFQQKSLITGFQRFLFTGTDAGRQIDFLLDTIDTSRNFFGFINFGETHAPFNYVGKIGSCPVDVRARLIQWPPKQISDAVGIHNEGFSHQVEAAEFLDNLLPRLFSYLPSNTIVILCADHGECFGEDGYWGHGFNHPAVAEVPLAIFRLDGVRI